MTTSSSSSGLEAMNRPHEERGDDFSFARRHRRTTRVLQGLVGLVVAVPLAWQLAADAPARATDTVTNPSAVIGVYAGAGQASEVLGIEHRLGLKSMYAMDFLDGSSWSTLSDPDWLLQVWGHTGLKMIWGVDMLPNSGASLAIGATGAYDSWYRLLAERLVAGGQGSSLIRLGWEFNGGWFPWAANGQAAAFVQYWRDIVDTMRSVPGGHFRFEWNPTRGDMGVGPLSEYYPGNQYVNVIGLDVYDMEWGHYPGAVAEWQHMLTQPYGLDWLASFGAAHGKPISFPEWGLGWGSGGNGPAGGGDNAYFVEHMAEFIRTHDVANAVAWDWGSRPMISSYYPAAEESFFSAFSPHAMGTPPRGIVASAASPATPGYWLANARGRVYGVHTPWAGTTSGASLSTQVAGIAASGSGYLLVNPKGRVYAFHATWHGSLAGRRLPAPVVGIAVDQRTGGYWLATTGGNVYPFAAPWRGSRARRGVAARIVGIAATPTGYLLVSARGNVYNFHTPWYGSKAHGRVPAPVVGIAVDQRTGGYWLVTTRGNVYAFGAPWLGSERGKRLSAPIVSIFASGAGYSLVSSSGAVYSFRPSGA